MKGLEEVSLVLCQSPVPESVPARRVALAKLKFNECNPSCLRSALRATSAAHIEILHLAESTRWRRSSVVARNGIRSSDAQADRDER
jgi:hypothetical protein